MKKNLFTVLLPLFLAFALIVLPSEGEEEIYDDVIRLHILAVSDSARDQEEKLAVRDAILSEFQDDFSRFADIEEAEGHMTEHFLEEIAACAEKTLLERGTVCSVTVTYTRELYPTRVYIDSRGREQTLPAGEYASLRVLLGEGEGTNWWCVLYPPLCTAAATEGVPLGLSDAEYRLIRGDGFSLRFKTLELLQRLFREKNGKEP